MPKKRHIIFHIGLPKSGTTTIQDDLLIPNARALSAIGVRPFVDRSSVVPLRPGLSTDVAAQTSVAQDQRAAYQALQTGSVDAPELVTFSDFSNYVFRNDLSESELSRLSDALSDYFLNLKEDRLVFSHEVALWSLVRGYPPVAEQGHERRLDSKRVMQARMASFHNRVFSASAERVTLVIALRRQDRLLRSLYNQSVKSTAMEADYAEFVLKETDLELLDFQNLIQLYQSWMPCAAFQVLFFEDMVSDPLGFLRQFGTIIGPDIRLDDATVPQRNSSLDWRTLEVKRLANQFPWTPEEHQILRKALESMGRVQSPEDCRVKDAEIDESVAFMFKSRNRQLVAWLEQSGLSSVGSSVAAFDQWEE